ncbi:hypothetical protein ES708_28985 [subsurface metagenome]
MKRRINGNARIKYNSSRKEVAITMADALPSFKPSLFTNIIATLVPPIADGVIADVNSHNIIIRKVWRHENFLSDNILSLIIYPKSRIAINTIAIIIQKTDFRSKFIDRNTSGSNFRKNMNTTTPRPIRTG